MSWILEYFIVFLLCVDICSAGYGELPILPLYLLRCLVYHMLSNTRRTSRSLHRVIAYIYLLCLIRCLVYHMLLGEVLVLGQLVVVYKIPCSSCIRARHECNWCVPIILLSIWHTVVACVILMVSPDVVDIGSDYLVAYLSCVYVNVV